MIGRSFWGSSARLGAVVILALLAPTVARATPAPKARHARDSFAGFVKEPALAVLLGEALFRDTVDLMSAFPDTARASATQSAPAAPGKGEELRDNSAVGRVARNLLTHQRLDKYLWLIRRAYASSLWGGGDRAQIERHFPLIWRTSILLYESSLQASPNRVRVCTPDDNGGDEFDCHDDLERARVVPIPVQMPLLGLQHQPNIG